MPDVPDAKRRGIRPSAEGASYGLRSPPDRNLLPAERGPEDALPTENGSSRAGAMRMGKEPVTAYPFDPSRQRTPPLFPRTVGPEAVPNRESGLGRKNALRWIRPA